MKVIAYCNQKGGVGKTTTTAYFAAVLAERGKKVLCIDLDPQPGNLSAALRADKQELVGSYELLIANPKTTNARDFIQTVDEIDIIAANESLSIAELALMSEISRETKLGRIIEPLRKDYDFILIDCPPSLGILTLNALTAADELIIPTTADSLSQLGMDALVDDVEKIRETLNPNLTIKGIAITQFRAGTRLQQDVAFEIIGNMNDLNIPVLKNKIRQSVVVQDAQKADTRLLDYKPQSAVVNDYRALVNECYPTKRR